MVSIQIPTVSNTEYQTFKFRTHSKYVQRCAWIWDCSVLEWSGPWLQQVLTIRKRNQYIEIQDGSYLVGFGMVWLFGFGIPFEIRTIQYPNNSGPFKIETS